MKRGANENSWFSTEKDHRDPLCLRLPARPEYVLLGRLIVAHVGQAVGFGPEEIYDLKLAVTEAATNVIRHAEVDVFEIEYRKYPGAIEISVVDFGGGFDAEARNAAPVTGGIEGGLGLSVIRNLVDEVSIESAPGKTCLKMMRHIEASVEAPSG